MNRLSISLLGTFQVRLAGEPVADFATDKVRALLAYLAVEAERDHRRQTLAGLLWPDFPEGAARTNLRNALANLRRAIGDRQVSPPFLQITRQTIQFNRASDYGLDVTTFSTLLANKGAARPGIASLEAGVALYRGPFLEGFALADSVPFEEWLLLNREALSRQLWAALHRLAEAYEEQGAYEQALGYARRQVALEPYQEEGQQQVMRLLALQGRRSEALAQYETCRQVLMDELGVEPSAETVALVERIRAGELSRGAGAQGRRGAGEQRRALHPCSPAQPAGSNHTFRRA